MGHVIQGGCILTHYPTVTAPGCVQIQDISAAMMVMKSNSGSQNIKCMENKYTTPIQSSAIIECE